MGARSKTLAQYSNPDGGTHLVYTVPSGEVTLLKSVLVKNWSGSQGVANVYITHVASGVTVGISSGVLQSQDSFEWNGWIALGSGDQLSVAGVAAPTHFWLSGAELTLI